MQDSYEVVGVGVAAQGPALKAELLDADDVPVWSAANVSFNSGEIVSVDPAQIVHSLRITGFSSLCEATLAVASQGAAAVPLQWKISSPANSTAWEAMVASSDNASSGVDASALVDGDLRTCVPLQPGSNASQEGNVTVQLSYILGQYSINTVHLLSNATLYNVSVAVIPDAGDGATAAQEADCDGPVTLQPWSLVPVSCGAAPQGSTLVIKVPAAQLEVPPTNGPAAGSLAPALCEVLVDGWKLEA